MKKQLKQRELSLRGLGRGWIIIRGFSRNLSAVFCGKFDQLLCYSSTMARWRRVTVQERRGAAGQARVWKEFKSQLETALLLAHNWTAAALATATLERDSGTGQVVRCLPAGRVG